MEGIVVGEVTEVRVRKKDKIQLIIIWSSVLISGAFLDWYIYSWIGIHSWDLFLGLDRMP